MILIKKLYQSLFSNGIHLVTKQKENIKKILTPIQDVFYLRKREIIFLSIKKHSIAGSQIN
jgi:hypothetical protein|tara:strand:- start:195 stop:377 length:183 start_codon:yes stop_codon:yes gene_type:complete